MKISTAIALGRTMIKAVAGTRNNGLGYGCALGMAEAAIGQTNYYKSAESNWRWITVPSLPLPCGCTGLVMGSGCHTESYHGGSWPTISSIVHLFNYHVMTKKDWTLDQLIDWLASIEPKEPEEVAVAAPVQEIMKEEVPVCP